MNTLTKNKTDELAALIMSGITSWVKAGQILVELIDYNESTLEEISKTVDMPVGILGRFEQLGRKQLIPDLLLADYPASKHMVKLPYSEQKRLISGSIEVLTVDDNDKINIATRNLTNEQCKQVFNSSSVRDIPAQRAWIESKRRRTKNNIIVSDMPYQIEKGQVTFNKGCVMKASQLVNILAQLTPKK